MSRDLRDVLVGAAMLAFVVIAFVTYDGPSSPTSSSSRPASTRDASPPPDQWTTPRVELDRAASSCAPDVLAGTVDVRLVLRNSGPRPARVSVFVKRGFHGGNDDGSALDLVDVEVPAHGRRALADTYPAHGERLVTCRVWLSDRSPGGTRDGYRDLAIGASS